MATFRVPVRISHAGGGGDAYNILHVRSVGPSDDDPDQVQDAVDAIRNFYDTCRGLYATTSTIYIGESVIKDPLGSPEYFPVTARTVTGNRAATIEPTLLAITVTWRTASATRSGRGRTFLGPLGIGVAAADGTPDDSDLTTIRGAATTLLAASGDVNGWAFGVLSTKESLFRDVTAYTVRDRFAYLSSRRD